MKVGDFQTRPRSQRIRGAKRFSNFLLTVNISGNNLCLLKNHSKAFLIDDGFKTSIIGLSAF